MYIQCSDGDDAEGEVDEEEEEEDTVIVGVRGSHDRSMEGQEGGEEEEEEEQMAMRRRHEDTFTRKLER